MNQDQNVIGLNLFNMKYFWLPNKSLSYKYILPRLPLYTYTVKRIIRDIPSGNNDVVAALLKSSSFNAMFSTMKYQA